MCVAIDSQPVDRLGLYVVALGQDMEDQLLFDVIDDRRGKTVGIMESQSSGSGFEGLPFFCGEATFDLLNIFSGRKGFGTYATFEKRFPDCLVVCAKAISCFLGIPVLGNEVAGVTREHYVRDLFPHFWAFRSFC